MVADYRVRDHMASVEQSHIAMVWAAGMSVLALLLRSEQRILQILDDAVLILVQGRLMNLRIAAGRPLRANHMPIAS